MTPGLRARWEAVARALVAPGGERPLIAGFRPGDTLEETDMPVAPDLAALQSGSWRCGIDLTCELTTWVDGRWRALEWRAARDDDPDHEGFGSADPASPESILGAAVDAVAEHLARKEG